MLINYIFIGPVTNFDINECGLSHKTHLSIFDIYFDNDIYRQRNVPYHIVHTQ